MFRLAHTNYIPKRHTNILTLDSLSLLKTPNPRIRKYSCNILRKLDKLSPKTNLRRKIDPIELFYNIYLYIHTLHQVHHSD
jgi:hypothetical protein